MFTTFTSYAFITFIAAYSLVHFYYICSPRFATMLFTTIFTTFFVLFAHRQTTSTYGSLVIANGTDAICVFREGGEELNCAQLEWKRWNNVFPSFNFTSPEVHISKILLGKNCPIRMWPVKEMQLFPSLFTNPSAAVIYNDQCSIECSAQLCDNSNHCVHQKNTLIDGENVMCISISLFAVHL